MCYSVKGQLNKQSLPPLNPAAQKWQDKNRIWHNLIPSFHPEHGVVQGRLSRRILKKETIECWDILIGKLLQVYEWSGDVQSGMGRSERAGVGRAEGSTGRRRAGLCLTGESGQCPSLSSSGRKVLGQIVHLATHKLNQTKAPKEKNHLSTVFCPSPRDGWACEKLSCCKGGLIFNISWTFTPEAVTFYCME